MKGLLTLDVEATKQENETHGNLNIAEVDTRKVSVTLHSETHEKLAEWVVGIVNDPIDFAIETIENEDTDGELDDYTFDRNSIDMQLRTSYKSVYFAAVKKAEGDETTSTAETLLRWVNVGSQGDEYIREFSFKAQRILRDVFMTHEVNDEEALETLA